MEVVSILDELLQDMLGVDTWSKDGLMHISLITLRDGFPGQMRPMPR